MKGLRLFLCMNLFRWIGLWMALGVSVLAVPGAGGAEEEQTLQVVALHPVLADWARQVGGERVEVFSLVPPGVDPHFFEPTPRDLRTISEADLLLAIGLGYESYLGKLRDAVGSRVQLVSVGEGLPNLLHGRCDHPEHGEAHHHHSDWDPHWWHGLEQAMAAVRLLRDRFVEADPEGAAGYRQRAEDYLAKMEELRRWAVLQIADLPRSRRVLVVSHDSLAYFARDFHFEVLTVAGISPGDQPGSRQLSHLIEDIRAREIPAVFVGSLENPRVLQELTRETGAVSGGVLLLDGLDEEAGADYLGMFRHNVTTIVQALR
jgi:zinc/manganese transport system substrate-binding protein